MAKTDQDALDRQLTEAKEPKNATDRMMEGKSLEAGTILSGRYAITGLIGKGGFAEVYDAYDQMIERSVAVKVLFGLGDTNEDSHAGKIERFKQEAKTAATIIHPNIVTIFDMGLFQEARPFIVMERLHGHDLGEELERNGPMRPTRLFQLFDKALDALAAGHKLGIVHRDLKPENLFLVAPEELGEDVRVLDFGVAKLNSVGARLTATGEMYGTAAYMAPEYILNGTVSPALDVYQMGLILVEMLTNKLVVEGDNPLACIVRHSAGDLSLPSELLKSPLGPVIAHALAMEPTERYHDAGAFRDALRQVDPALVPMVSPSGQSLKMRDVSANIRSVSDFGISDTGTFAPGSSRSSPMAQTRTMDGERVLVGVAGAAAAAQDAAPLSQPLIDSPTPSPAAEPSPPVAAPANGPPKWLKIALVAALPVVMLLLGIGSAAFFFGDKTPPKPEVQAPVAKKSAPPSKAPAEPKAEAKVEPPAPVKEAPVAVEPAKKAPEEVAAPPQKVEVEIVTSPPGARVFNGKERLGKSPFVWTFEPGQKDPVTLQIKRAGFHTLNVTVRPEDGPRKDVILKSRPKNKDSMGLAD